MLINTEKLAKLLAAIEKEASKKGGPTEEEWIPLNAPFYGNTDDAYDDGFKDGEIGFARHLMEILK